MAKASAEPVGGGRRVGPQAGRDVAQRALGGRADAPLHHRGRGAREAERVVVGRRVRAARRARRIVAVPRGFAVERQQQQQQSDGARHYGSTRRRRARAAVITIFRPGHPIYQNTLTSGPENQRQEGSCPDKFVLGETMCFKDLCYLLIQS